MKANYNDKVVINSVTWMSRRIAMPSLIHPWDPSQKQNTTGLDRVDWPEVPILCSYDFPALIGELPENILPVA